MTFVLVTNAYRKKDGWCAGFSRKESQRRRNWASTIPLCGTRITCHSCRTWNHQSSIPTIPITSHTATTLTTTSTHLIHARRRWPCPTEYPPITSFSFLYWKPPSSSTAAPRPSLIKPPLIIISTRLSQTNSRPTRLLIGGCWINSLRLSSAKRRSPRTMKLFRPMTTEIWSPEIWASKKWGCQRRRLRVVRLICGSEFAWGWIYAERQDCVAVSCK